MKAKKWNFEKSKYEIYELPKSASMYEKDMDKIVSCAECGSKLAYGDTYTSRRIHTNTGMGYMVCKKCYDEELLEEVKYRE